MAPAKHSVFPCFTILCFALLCFRPVIAQTQPVYACDVANNPGLKNFSFCDPSLSVQARVDDLVSRLTLQEKIGWLVNTAKGVSRLGIPNYEWWSEALHGVSYIGPGTKFSSLVPGATSFPQVLLTAATFDESLFETIGKVTQQDMDDTFQPPFKSCVLDGNVASVMCSYNQVNGKPTCGDPDLLAGVIRGEWKLNGYIVSDCDSLNEMFNAQHYTKTPEETAALAVNSGLDLNCGSFLSTHAQTAVNRGLLNESTINKAVSNNFATMMRLGFFDGNPSKQLYGDLGPKDVCTTANRELAREVARQGIVLLKNTEGSLPLSPSSIKSLAVIGPNANVTHTMLGNYEGSPCKYTTPLQGLTASVATVYQAGCADTKCGSAQVDAAKKIAATADAVVLVMGSDQSIEGESLDRVDITLPGQQQILISEVAKISKGPVILVIMSGGGMDVQFAKDDPKITSIMWVGFPGEAGGAAIADVIFGSYNPSGRLPMTWYPQSYAESVNMTDMHMRANPATGYPGRSYRFYKGPTVFSFGDGLSYTSFNHKFVRAPELVSVPLEEGHACRSKTCESIDAVEESCKNLGLEVHLSVKNMGKMRGSETVLLFSTPPEVHNAPRKQLVGFKKVDLEAEGEGVVRFYVDVCKHLSVVDENGSRKVALGEHVLHVGNLKHSFSVGI